MFSLHSTWPGTLKFLERFALALLLMITWPEAGLGETAVRELSFEQNLGQLDSRVDFVVRAAGYTGFLSGGDVHLRLEPATGGARPSGLVLELDDRTDARARGERQLAGRSHYLEGADPERWIRDVPHFGQVRYAAVYPGIDLVYRSAAGALEYDFLVAPGSEPDQIALVFQGAESLAIDGDGSLLIETASGTIQQRPPVAFQRRFEGGVDRVEAAFAMADDRVVFELGAWDRDRELIIDPPLTFSTFLGGALAEFGKDVAVDATGNAYVVGWTRSDDFPVTPGVYQEIKSGGATQGNLFLSKLDPTGSTLLYSTFLGASSHVQGEAVAVDAFGQAYVLAQAGPLSDLFTTANAVQSTVGLFNHTYVAKFDAAGSNILYATFLTGSNGSTPGDLEVDSIGDVYATGVATGLGFPLRNGFQTSVAGIGDVFLVKLDPLAASSLLYATFLGGGSGESADALAVDAAGRAYLTGYTQSTNFPVSNAIQPANSGGFDAYATAIDPGASGSASLIYSTYLGGSSTENGTAQDGGVAVDSLGFATFGGTTSSTDLPTTAGTLQPALAGSSDAFLYRLDPAGALVFATYFGGSGIEQLKDLDVDSIGRIALFGYTLSVDLPVHEAFQPSRTNSADLFLSVLSAPASSLIQSSYLGGDANAAENAGGVAFDEASCSLLAAGHAAPGSALAPFPTTGGSYQPNHAGETDAFLVKWSYCSLNQPPVGVTDAYGAFEDQPLTIPMPGVLANDSDPDGDNITAMLDTQAAHGMVTMNPNGSFTYQPTTPDYNGGDSFTYFVHDPQTSTGPVLVTLDIAPVNDPPVAQPDSAVTAQGMPVAIDVLANDSDVDGDPLIVATTTQGTNGGVTILPTFEVQYSPNLGFVGVDTFTYVADDLQGGTASALVTVTVEPGLIEVPVDAVPKKCPNPVKLQGGGKTRFVIASTATFDATTVDPATVESLGLAPVQTFVRDTATPYVPFLGKQLATDCHSLGGDGLLDLEVRFDKQDLLNVLEVANGGPLAVGQVIVAPLTGNLLPASGGIAIVGEDVILIQ